jgi:hypothetical protein
LLLIAGGYQKLSEVDFAGSIGVDQGQHPFDFVLGQRRFGGVEGRDELMLFDDPIAVLIDEFEDFEEVLFVLVGVQLRGDEGVDHCFEFVFELFHTILT